MAASDLADNFRLAMRAKDGDTYRAGASYREIVKPERLVYTWQWVGEGMPNVETLIAMTLAEREGGTDVKINHSGFPDAAMCESHREGWGSCLNRLSDALDPRGTAASVALLGDPRSTYMRTARMGLAGFEACQAELSFDRFASAVEAVITRVVPRIGP